MTSFIARMVDLVAFVEVSGLVHDHGVSDSFAQKLCQNTVSPWVVNVPHRFIRPGNGGESVSTLPAGSVAQVNSIALLIK